MLKYLRPIIVVSHSQINILNFQKLKLHLEQITYEELVCLYSRDSTDLKETRQNVKSILKAKVHFYLHRAYYDISAECTLDTICCFSGWLNMKHSRDLLAEYSLNMTALWCYSNYMDIIKQKYSEFWVLFLKTVSQLQDIWIFDTIILKHYFN